MCSVCLHQDILNIFHHIIFKYHSALLRLATTWTIYHCVCVWVCVCVCVCVCVRARVCMCVGGGGECWGPSTAHLKLGPWSAYQLNTFHQDKSVQKETWRHRHTHACMHTHTHICIHMCARTHTHTHTHAHTHTETEGRKGGSSIPYLKGSKDESTDAGLARFQGRFLDEAKELLVLTHVRQNTVGLAQTCCIRFVSLAEHVNL